MTLYTENPTNIKSLELTHKFSRIAVFKQVEGEHAKSTTFLYSNNQSEH